MIKEIHQRLILFTSYVINDMLGQDEEDNLLFN